MSKQTILVTLIVEVPDDRPAIEAVLRTEEILLRVFKEEQITEVKLERKHI